MGNTSIQTQSYRAVDKDAGQSRSYIIPFALLCSLFFLWAVANNLCLLFHYPNPCWDIDEKTQL